METQRNFSFECGDDADNFFKIILESKMKLTDINLKIPFIFLPWDFH